MTGPIFLAGDGEIASPTSGRQQLPTLILESMDGSARIRLDNSEGWIRMPGTTGLGMAPVEVISEAIPGVPGSNLTDVRVDARPIFIPIYGGSEDGNASFRQMMSKLYALVDPMGRKTFRLVGESAGGSRELIVTYISGLEGADGPMEAGLSWAKFGLNLVAHQPFAQAREERTLEFRTSATVTPFLGAVGGTDAPWPRSLVTSAVIGEGMSVFIESEVPVYPTVRLAGPMTSFQGDLTPITDDDSEADWNVDIPGGVAANFTLRMVTDPRVKSFRYGPTTADPDDFVGGLAASRVALGSRLSPFYPGENALNVAAPGSTSATVISISWRDLYRSLWG